MRRVKEASSNAVSKMETESKAKVDSADRKTAQAMARAASLEHERRAIASEAAESKATLAEVEAALASAKEALHEAEYSNKSIRAADAAKHAKEVSLFLFPYGQLY